MLSSRALTSVSTFVCAAAVGFTVSAAHACDTRLNKSVVGGVHSVQYQPDYTNDVGPNMQLRLAAQWHTDDVLGNRGLDGDVDAFTSRDQINANGFHATDGGTAAIAAGRASAASTSSTSGIATPPAMRSCPTAPTPSSPVIQNSLDRTVVAAGYGKTQRFHGTHDTRARTRNPVQHVIG